jgi:hypothetical protein
MFLQRGLDKMGKSVHGRAGQSPPIIVIAGLDPAIHPLREMHFVKLDGCAGQARA